MLATAVRPSGVTENEKNSPASPTVDTSLPDRSSHTNRVAIMPACQSTMRFSEAEKNGDPGAVKVRETESRTMGSPRIFSVFGSQAAAMRLFARPKRR